MLLKPSRYVTLYLLASSHFTVTPAARVCRRCQPLTRSFSSRLVGNLTMHTGGGGVGKLNMPDRLLHPNVSNLRAPSPLGSNGDDDSEAESYRDGRTEEVDKETRDRAFAWCRDFLSGSWKTIPESDFQISIVR